MIFRDPFQTPPVCDFFVTLCIRSLVHQRLIAWKSPKRVVFLFRQKKQLTNQELLCFSPSRGLDMLSDRKGIKYREKFFWFSQFCPMHEQCQIWRETFKSKPLLRPSAWASKADVSSFFTPVFTLSASNSTFQSSNWRVSSLLILITLGNHIQHGL